MAQYIECLAAIDRRSQFFLVALPSGYGLSRSKSLEHVKFYLSEVVNGWGAQWSSIEKMADYRTVDKTAWFIQHMRAGWFSRQEIMEMAAKEFPDIPVKTLEGTIGQYWSDSVNPKWGTYKAIQARGLKVVENGGKRRIVEGSETVSLPVANNSDSTLKPFPASVKPSADAKSRGDRTHEMWNSNDLDLWQGALNRYWTFVKAANFELEKEMEHLDAEAVRAMNPREWFTFLLEKYFLWKYTAPTWRPAGRSKCSHSRQQQLCKSSGPARPYTKPIGSRDGRLRFVGPGLPLLYLVLGFVSATPGTSSAVLSVSDWCRVAGAVPPVRSALPDSRAGGLGAWRD